MAEASAGRVDGIGSATHLMIEALEKASLELDKAVKASQEQLNGFSSIIEKNFSNRLTKLAERAASSVESSVEDVLIRKDEYADRLQELERAELEAIITTAREVREQLAETAQKASDSISQLVEEQMGQLRTLVENPQEHFAEFSDVQIESIGKYGNENKGKIEQSEQNCEERISREAQKFDKGVPAVLAESKKKVDENLDKHQKEFEDKITSVIERLSNLVNMTMKELEDQVKAGKNAIFDFNETARKQLTNRVDKWEGELTNTHEEFLGSIAKSQESFELNHSKKLDRKVAEVKEEIDRISHEAQAKLGSSQKLFQGSLKRLERKYGDRLEHLFAGFEAALVKEAKLPAGTTSYRWQASHELRDLLQARLTARSNEIVKAFTRQVEQLDSEYIRINSTSQEKIDTIKSTAFDGLDKQVRNVKIETERILKGFRNEVQEMDRELPQIEDAGKAAALAVMAYQSAMLSFGSD